MRPRERYRGKELHTQRETDIQTERERERDTGARSYTERQTDRQTDRERERRGVGKEGGREGERCDRERDTVARTYRQTLARLHTHALQTTDRRDCVNTFLLEGTPPVVIVLQLPDMFLAKCCL